MALIGTIVPEEQRIRASSLSMIMANIGWVAGPAIAGLLFSMVGVQWAIVINAASFAFSFLMIFLIKVPRSVESHKIEQPHFGREFLAGLKFSLGNRVVSTLLVTSVIFSLCAGALNALYLFFLTQNLHASADLYGLFCALPGLGGVVGSALAGKLAQRIGASRTRWLSLLLWSCVGLLFARQVHFVPAAICVFLIGMLNMGIAVAASPLILKVTPEKMRGRVFSVFSTLSTCASLLSLSLAGLAYSTVLHSFHTSLFGLPVGPVDLMYSVGALLVGVGGLYEMLTTFYQKL
jgi:MFS family permease